MALQSHQTLVKGMQDALMTGLQADADVIYQKAADESERPGLQARVIYDDMGTALKGMPLGLNRVMVIMYNDAVRGISLKDDGPIIGDAIWVASVAGADPKWCRIVKRIRANNNMVTWEVR
jgi:hypothetical protein